MTKEFQILIRLMTAGAVREQLVEPLYNVDWMKIEQLAEDQMSAALVGYALKLSPEIGCPEDIRSRMFFTMRKTAVVNATKFPSIVGLLNRMEHAGIHTVLLKGFEVASCYAAPECRGSGDTDILVAPEDERKACHFLEKEGFYVVPRWKHGHHAVATHPDWGIVELHILLYDEIIEDMWFGKKNGAEYVLEPHRLVHTEFGDYYSLGDTDHLIFLALHAIKHFIESGMSVRMMLDIALWINCKKDTLDMARFWRVMDSLQYSQLVNCMLHALIRYGSFTEGDFQGLGNADAQHIDMILTDIEEGGWLGIHNKSDREKGWHEYNRQKMLQYMKPWQYKLYMFKWQVNHTRTIAFPPKEKMVCKYPFLGEKPWLLPFAWLHRLIFRGRKAARNGALTNYVVNDKSELTGQAKARVEMFKALEMM